MASCTRFHVAVRLNEIGTNVLYDDDRGHLLFASAGASEKIQPNSRIRRLKQTSNQLDDDHVALESCEASTPCLSSGSGTDDIPQSFAVSEPQVLWTTLLS